MYCVRLSRRLKKTIQETLELSFVEVNLQMAYDLANSDSFIKGLEQEEFHNQWKNLDREKKREIIIAAFGAVPKDKKDG